MIEFPILAFVIIPAVLIVAVIVGDHIDKVNRK